jgi:GR25 family glycosyltransferase involved in LPS biosynthesis
MIKSNFIKKIFLTINKKQNSKYFYTLLFILILFIFYFIYFKNQKYLIEKFSEKKINNSSFIPVYIINLDRSKDRWEKIVKQCEKENINYYRIEAIDGMKIDRNEYKSILHKKNMKDNTIACFLSHMKSLKTFLESIDNYAVILEDDVIIQKDFNKKIKTIFEELKEKNQNKIDLIFLGGTRVCGMKYTKSLMKPTQINQNCNAGTFGYLLSKNGARIIYDKMSNDGIHKMYDHQLRDYFGYLNVFTCNPPLIVHDFEQESVRMNKMYNENYIESALSINVK